MADNNSITVNLTRVQEKALIQYAIIRILEDKMEAEAEITKMHEDNELIGLQDVSKRIQEQGLG